MVARTEQEPITNLKLGKYEGRLEDCLKRYSSEFIKDVREGETAYILVREDPSHLLMVFDAGPDAPIPKNCAGIAVVSYGLQRNEEILLNFARKTKMSLTELVDEPLLYRVGKELAQACEELFLHFTG